MDGLGTSIANAIAAGLQGASAGYEQGLALNEQAKVRKYNAEKRKIDLLDAKARQREFVRAARQRAQINNARLEQMAYQRRTRPPEELIQEQQKLLMQQVKQTQAMLAKQATYDAFNRFNADGNTHHLNQAVQNTPMLRELYDDVAHIAPFDPSNPQDSATLKQLGVENYDENAKKKYLKVIHKDGSVSPLDMDALYKGTGYYSYLDDKKLEQLIKLHKAAGRAPAPSAYGKFVEDYKKYHPEASQEEIDAAYGSRERTAKQKDLDEAQKATQDLVSKFGGEDKFFQTDFSKRENLTKAYPDVAKIEKLEGIDFSEAEKKQLNDIRTLIALGDPAKQLSKKETGLMDSFLLGLRKYISNNTEGINATSAYNAFRNSVRHTLYGSALTDSEIKSFNDAFGTLGNQLGPVLQQFKTSLMQVKAHLDSISRMKNPYSAYVRLGVDQKKLSKIQQAIDERLQYIDKMEKAKAKPKNKRKPLGDIL